MAAAIAPVASIASLALSAGGSIMKGEGTQAADDYQAAQSEQAAQFATLQAKLSDTTYRQNLSKTLGTIEAMRATGNVDITSPTTTAIEDWNTQLSDTQRLAKDVTLRSQAAEDTASAAYLRQAGNFAFDQGIFSAGAGLAGGIAKGIPT